MKYVLIDKDSFTQEQINFSTVKSEKNLQSYISTENFLWIFPIDTVFHVFEFEENNQNSLEAFKKHQFYSKEEILQIIDELNAAKLKDPNN